MDYIPANHTILLFAINIHVLHVMVIHMYWCLSSSDRNAISASKTLSGSIRLHHYLHCEDLDSIQMSIVFITPFVLSQNVSSENLTIILTAGAKFIGAVLLMSPRWEHCSPLVTHVSCRGPSYQPPIIQGNSYI